MKVGTIGVGAVGTGLLLPSVTRQAIESWRRRHKSHHMQSRPRCSAL
jgi:hypothetical protein